MKKMTFFCILALVICSVISCNEREQFEQELQTQKREQLKEKLSHEVTQSEARENLEKILTKLNIPSTRGGDGKLPPITSVYTRGKAAMATRAGEAVEPYFHIFNFGDNEGFAIMSGDDRVEPLLALTFKGELTPETEIDNPGLEIAYEKMEEYYVKQVSSRIIEIPGTTIPPKDSLPDPIIIDSTYYYEMPLGHCPVNWHQDSPYNARCVIQVEGRDTCAQAGCVTVAVAQLMAMYKYPNSYYYLPHDETGTFDWDDMTSNNPSSESVDQIAHLMSLLGKGSNLSANYGVSSTPVFSHLIPRTLEAFGYANGGDLVSYDTETVVSELQSGYPVLIGGKRMKENGKLSGHRWLGHGLMKLISTHKVYIFPRGWITLDPPFERYYILCNWGWGGNANGYYLSNVFNVTNGAVYPDPIYPNDKKINYNYEYEVDVVINIRK